MNIALAAGITFLMAILRRTVRRMWDDIWEQVFEAVVQAEEQYGRGLGQEKKQAVISTVETWVRSRVESWSFIHSMILRYVLSRLIDAVIAQVNEALGHDWLKAAQETKTSLEQAIPFLGKGSE